MGTSVKESLLAAAKIRTTEIDVEGAVVRVREVGAMEFAVYGQLLKTDQRRATASLIASCVVDENGQPVLTLEDAHELVQSSRVSMPIVNAIMELSGFGKDELEKHADAD